MNREWVIDETTIGLVKELLGCKQRYVDISKSGWFRSPVKRWGRDKKLRDLTQTSQAVGSQLSVRYEGILLQMAQRVKASDPLTETEWKDAQTTIWELMKTNARTMSNYRRFSGVLWDVCVSEFGSLGNVASLMSLRPKFMLRQFVDEMQSSDARGILRTMAFGEPEETKLGGRELLNSLERAFPVIHMYVLRRINDLSALTDGEITAEMVNPIQAPFAEYRRWLFES